MLKTIILLLLITASQFCFAQRQRPVVMQVKTKFEMVKKRLRPAEVFNDTTAARSGFVQVPYRIYRYNDLARNEVNGIILLSNYDAGAPNLLVLIAQMLANANYIVAIIQHHADQSKSFTAQADTLGKDYQHVWKEISAKYGGTKSKTVIGGISFSGFAISYLVNQPNNWFSDIKGIALIAASTNPYVKLPVINKVCKMDPDVTDDYGNRGGTDLQNEMHEKNPSIAALSSCETDIICTGHTTSDSWASFFISKIKAWLP